MNIGSRPLAGRRLARAQRGVVLLFALIALVILLIGGVALIRSFNTSLFTAGNQGFKRDMMNQAERALAHVRQQMVTGDLATMAARADNRLALNYSATILPTNAQGIPLALLSNAAFAGVATGADITDAEEKQGVTIRYVIDRLCSTAGADNTLSSEQCTVADQGEATDGDSVKRSGAQDARAGAPAAITKAIVYRLSVRVNGPRSTQAFFQSTFTPPETP